jgi:hypothetical protein
LWCVAGENVVFCVVERGGEVSVENFDPPVFRVRGWKKFEEHGIDLKKLQEIFPRDGVGSAGPPWLILLEDEEGFAVFCGLARGLGVWDAAAGRIGTLGSG